jgi:hypothetical protein
MEQVQVDFVDVQVHVQVHARANTRAGAVAGTGTSLRQSHGFVRNYRSKQMRQVTVRRCSAAVFIPFLYI